MTTSPSRPSNSPDLTWQCVGCGAHVRECNARFRYTRLTAGGWLASALCPDCAAKEPKEAP